MRYPKWNPRKIDKQIINLFKSSGLPVEKSSSLNQSNISTVRNTVVPLPYSVQHLTLLTIVLANAIATASIY
jgi:hypothetical protein